MARGVGRNNKSRLMPFALIPFLLLIVPVIEIAVFIIVGGKIGVAWTLACILLTAIIGSILLRVQGLSIISRIQNELAHDRVPGRELGDGLKIIIAAVLLLTPGFVTDAIGFLLFVPFVRSALWRFAASRISVHMVGRGDFRGQSPRPGWSPGDDRVVDLDADDFHETPSARPSPGKRLGGR